MKPAEIIAREIVRARFKVVVGKLFTDDELDAIRSNAHEPYIDEACSAAIKALAEAGYAVVPRDATDAALSAGLQASLDMMREHGVDGLSPFADYPPPIEVCRRVYRAMLDAAEGGERG